VVKQSASGAAEQESARLTIAVYQNGDHVSGILQQAYDRGVLRNDTRESGQQSTRSQAKDSKTDLGLEAGADVPFMAKAQGRMGYGRSRQSGDESRQEDRVTSTFEYTEAYYLHVVRRHLSATGMLRSVSTVTDAMALAIGDFVEFQAGFRPNQVTPFLDILTPDFVGRIAHYRQMRGAADKLGAVQGFDGLDGFDRIKAFAEQAKMRADADADIARSVAAAVQADFRGAATREYYASIGTGDRAVTAVTICDAPCFLLDDADRLLDGSFTVLGKVSSPVATDVPVLSRNKLLSRLDVDFVDEALNQLREATKKSATKLPGDQSDAIESVLDANLEARIAGPSFNVIPIAIYL
jgi:hypothetical protein